MVHKFLHWITQVLKNLNMFFVPDKNRLPYLTFRAVFFSAEYCFVVFNIAYMFLVWGDLEAVSEALYLLFTQATTCLKATTVCIIFKNRLKKLLKFMESDIFAAQSEIQEK